uniref:NADH-ubiquinone oxidoreductase chain 6 n=1 Tax=Triops cancriformis TaxID=194544 RepID=Q8HCU2_TRICB|nr:NADH dehydrogenase subunit 6 [Triops cancriformis]QCZ36072.1 NADH dehydrogenase subunit 6 [Triops cancriformis]QCZ36085.1 NADH dehydrogenase subunit 6 [Triops cancriformis]BAC53604.1 NADH dehydrogenase subunit 6 [Triops cancriformis]
MMMKLMMTLLVINSLMFMFLIHPLSMGLNLMIQSLLICLYTGSFFLNYWFSYTLFLIFLGGLLVLFIYISSLASNEMFQLNVKLMFFLSLCFLSIFLILSFLYETPWTTMIAFTWSKMVTVENMVSHVYKNSNIQLMLFMVTYLLVTLLVVVNITKLDVGPLRLLK